MNFFAALTDALKTKKAKNKRIAGSRAYMDSGSIHFSKLAGYTRVVDRYEPDGKMSEHIRIILTMLADGQSLLKVKKHLDSINAKDSSHNRYGFAKILSLVRVVYAGYIRRRGLVRLTNLTPLVSLDVYKRAAKQARIEQRKLVAPR
ncbi:MAG: hypothetical protein KBB32_01490 [Spirochaetia bacterium]|nr:hypothetical protein [Spirochaetia bacterium]